MENWMIASKTRRITEFVSRAKICNVKEKPFNAINPLYTAVKIKKNFMKEVQNKAATSLHLSR